MLIWSWMCLCRFNYRYYCCLIFINRVKVTLVEQKQARKLLLYCFITQTPQLSMSTPEICIIYYPLSLLLHYYKIWYLAILGLIIFNICLLTWIMRVKTDGEINIKFGKKRIVFTLLIDLKHKYHPLSIAKQCIRTIACFFCVSVKMLAADTGISWQEALSV